METSQYLELFIEESREHLQTCNDQLLALEQSPDDLSIVNELFRAAHTIKGMSATMGYTDLADLTHKMENVMDRIRHGEIQADPSVLDVLFRAVDQLEEMIEDIASGGTGALNVADTVAALLQIENGENGSSVQEAEESALVYDSFEAEGLKQAREMGLSAYELKVSLQEGCMLKGVRAYMVVEELSAAGDVIKTSPPAEELEQGEFESAFYAVVITPEPEDAVRSAVLNVSEVAAVEISSPSGQVGKTESSAKPETETEAPAEPGKEKAGERSLDRQKVQNKTIRVSIDRLDMLMNLFEELIIDRGRLQSIAGELQNGALTETVERMTRISGDLQSVILNMRMVPVDTVFNRFPKMVRQLSRDLGKKIQLEISGAETELDRTVIDEIGDPLVHLIRNALDHGIETPEMRLKRGKPEEGTLQLRAYHSGNHVFIEIQDDGGGISREHVLKKAVANGVVTEERAAEMPDKAVYELIMASGFSTAETISDISGRGVGLDVVKTTIESLGGQISIGSEEGKGSIFSVQLPLTLSIIAAMLVRTGDEVYAVPLSSIVETMSVPVERLLTVENRRMMEYRGKVIPFLSLREVFGIPSEDGRKDEPVLIVQKGEKLAALSVDAFIDQQEIVLKPLGSYLTDVYAISGATILGDGKVALIIDCSELIQ